MPKSIKSPEPRQEHFIGAWRDHRGLTLEQLAEKLGTTKQSLSRIEAGKQPYTQDSLEAMAIYLRCSTSDLLHTDPTKEKSDWSIFDLAPENQAKAKDVIKAFKAAEQAESPPQARTSKRGR